MAANKPRSKRSAATETKPSVTSEAQAAPPVAVPEVEMYLADFRVVKMLAERFIEPEHAKMGTFSMKIDDGVISVVKSNSRPELHVSYGVSITGNRIDMIEGARQTGPKSFYISASVEGTIECRGIEIGEQCEDELIKKHSIESIRVVHALTINSLREEASQMGYRSVRPSLGLRLNQLPILTIETASKQV